MELQTINQVSKAFGISARMLRYYEQIGLIKSLRKEDYAYRVYDETATTRIQAILLLRKLRVPMRQISIVLNQPGVSDVIKIFNQTISEISNEINALSTIKNALGNLADELLKQTGTRLEIDMLTDTSVFSIVDSIPLSNNHIKESFSMDTMNELTSANNILNKLSSARIIFVPPMTVAGVHYEGENANEKAAETINKFVIESNLLKIKPDMRCIGFDNPLNPYGMPGGYELWVSIPDDMDVPSPLTKKKFFGGQYAAHAITNGDWDAVLGLQDWVAENSEFQADPTSIRCNPHSAIQSFYLEEQINFFQNVQNPNLDLSTIQIDFLHPIKPVEPLADKSLEIVDSVEKCGFKAKLVLKNKIAVIGYTKIMAGDLGDNPVIDFWNELKSSGRLDILQKHRKPGASIFGHGSHDLDSQKRGGWRYTICLMESDVTDIKSLEAHNLFIKKVDASEWLCFEMAKEQIFGFDGHSTVPKLGYRFNPPISGSFDVFPDGLTGVLDSNDIADKESIVYHWFPVIK